MRVTYTHETDSGQHFWFQRDQECGSDGFQNIYLEAKIAKKNKKVQETWSKTHKTPHSTHSNKAAAVTETKECTGTGLAS